MSAAAEHALRTLAEELDPARRQMTGGTAYMVMKALAAAHHATADRLQAEREEREAKARENPAGFSYDTKGGRRQGRS